MIERVDGSTILLTGEPGERHWQLGAFPAGDGLGLIGRLDRQ